MNINYFHELGSNIESDYVIFEENISNQEFNNKNYKEDFFGIV